MQRQTWTRTGLALLALLMVVLAACQTATEMEPMITVTTDKQDDTAEVQREDGRAIIDVTSQSGIGGMQVALQEGQWPAEVIVRLHLAGLERLEIGYDQYLIATGKSSNSSPDPALMLYVIDENNEVEEASPSADIYYPEINIVTADGAAPNIPLRDGYFEITMPAHFYEVSPESFTMQWIDFYR